MINFTGLGSGLDISGLVDSLVAAERAGSDLQLNRQSAKLKSKFSALGSLQGALSVFNDSLANVKSISSFTRNTASSSSAAELNVSATSTAVANNYNVVISQLAQSHSLASGVVADTDTTELGTGALTIRFGTTDYDADLDTYSGFVVNPDRNTATITIDSSNNTLNGLMLAINDADIGVSASIVNDGTGFRLLLTSAETGNANSLEISAVDNDGNNTDLTGLSQFAFNAAATNLDQSAAAQNALFSINGLAISHTSNTVNSAIPGVNLTLNQVSTGPIRVEIKRDTEAVTSAINTFITGYNKLITTAKALSAYNPDTNTGAPLIGDFTLRSIEGQINSIMRGSVPGLTGSITTLAGLGIKTLATGELTLDSSKLSDALANRPEEVMQMFASVGVPSGSGVSFSGAGNATKVGDYAVEITALASSGQYVGASVLPNFGGGGSLTIDGNNDNLSLTVDGIGSGVISLTQSTYNSGASLAAELQTRINGASALSDAGISVTVSYDSGSNSLSITSDSLGSNSVVDILTVDTNTAADFGFSVGAGTNGVDVAGRIGGVDVVGTGNILVGATGSDAEGLRLIITGATLGDRGSVNFTRGMASQLDTLFGQLLGTDSALNSRLSSVEDRIGGVEDRRAELETRWETIRARYLAQFNALDSLLGQLESTSTYLEGQFNSLLKPNSGQNN